MDKEKTAKNIVIYSRTLRIGTDFLERIILNKVLFKDVLSYKEKPLPMLLLKDGTQWSVYVAGEYIRGFRYDIAYIDETIDEEIKQGIIYPYGEVDSQRYFFTPYEKGFKND